jgi:hypothetical protein
MFIDIFIFWYNYIITSYFWEYLSLKENLKLF